MAKLSDGFSTLTNNSNCGFNRIVRKRARALYNYILFNGLIRFYGLTQRLEIGKLDQKYQMNVRRCEQISLSQLIVGCIQQV